MSDTLTAPLSIPATDDSSASLPLADGPSRSARKAVRNLAIFKKVEIEKLTHEEVARLYKMTRGRVSQIVQEVRLRLAHAHPDDKQIENHLARQRLERELEKMRYQYALDAAAKAIRRDPATLVTNRAGSSNKGGQQQTWSETINRDKPASHQLIKTYVRITRDLGQLNEREIERNPIDAQKMTHVELFEAVTDALDQWCDEAPDSDDPPSEAFHDLVSQFLRHVLTWLRRWRSGSSAADAWPPPPKQPPVNSPSTIEEINHDSSEINIGLTSSDSFTGGTTIEAQTT